MKKTNWVSILLQIYVVTFKKTKEIRYKKCFRICDDGNIGKESDFSAKKPEYQYSGFLF